MLTKADITYSGQKTDRVIMAIALGIEGEVLITLPTFVDFYEFLLENTDVACVTESCDVVEFRKEGGVLETLQVDSFLGSVLASNPDILEIVRRNPDNTLVPMTDEIRTKMAVTPGWRYYGGEFIAPEGWTLPPLPTKEHQDALKKLLNN